MLKRPKSDGRCIHCRERLIKRTKDHVFPSSWYPDSTSPEIHRWTVPSCQLCNGKFGAMERELLVRLAPCVNPQKIAALGISKRALRALGIGTTELGQDDVRHRNALRDKINREVRAFSSDDQARVLPGMGPHPELPASEQLRFEVPAKKLREVGKKIVRGCEYWLGNGRIIEPPYETEIFFPRQLTQDVLRAFAPTSPVYLGPGFRVRRAAAVDDLGVAMYEIVVWDSLTIFGMVMPPDEKDSVSP